MALRLLEIILPEQYGGQVSELLIQNEVNDHWFTCGCDSKVIIKIILQAEKTELIMDALERKYGHLEGFRLVLLPLEASFPAPHAIEKKAEENQENNEKEKVPARVSRQELYNEIFFNSKLNRNFLIMVLLSTIVAAVGLQRDNVAIIIGAMVIAPLLGPNVALSLATTLGDRDLGINAVKTNIAGLLLSFVTAIGLGLMLTVNPSGVEISSRTLVGYGDIVLALASGIAGALAYTSGTVSTLIGVMVAVALVPPLVTSGLLLGSGHLEKSLNALLLVGINMICINIAGVVTFLLQGIRPMSWWEADKAKKATRKAIIIWSVLLLILFVLIYVKAV